MTDTDKPTNADDAAAAVAAYLDVREQWAEHWGTPENLAIPIVTQPRRGTEGPFWLLLTHDDLRTVLADRTRLLAEAASLRAELAETTEELHHVRITGEI